MPVQNCGNHHIASVESPLPTAHTMTMKTGVFSIVHQSPSKVFLNGVDSVPLYCVCSGHCMKYEYEWTVNGRVQFHCPMGQGIRALPLSGDTQHLTHSSLITVTMTGS